MAEDYATNIGRLEAIVAEYQTRMVRAGIFLGFCGGLRAASSISAVI